MLSVEVAFVGLLVMAVLMIGSLAGLAAYRLGKGRH
jgi:hypothetical protein